jgi:hypothetical protein
VVLVFVDETVALLSLYHQLVVPESSIDEGVDKGAGKICPGGVDICCDSRSYGSWFGTENCTKGL